MHRDFGKMCHSVGPRISGEVQKCMERLGKFGNGKGIILLSRLHQFAIRVFRAVQPTCSALAALEIDLLIALQIWRFLVSG